MTIKVTLEFASEDELIRYFARDKAEQAGKSAAAPPGAAGQATAPAGAAPAKTAKDKNPAAESAAAKPQASTAATAEGKPAAASSSQDKPAASSASSAARAASPLDYKPVGDAIVAYAAKYGREAAIDMLAGFGVKSGKELKPEQYAAVLEAFSKEPEVA